MRAVCVVYVEGKQTLLRSVKQVLEPAYEVVAMADNALSLVDAITSLAPPLVVMDPGGTGSLGSIVRHVRHRFAHTGLIVLTDDADPVIAREFKSWGVQGLVVRARVAEDLCAAMGEVLAGRSFGFPEPTERSKRLKAKPRGSTVTGTARRPSTRTGRRRKPSK